MFGRISVRQLKNLFNRITGRYQKTATSDSDSEVDSSAPLRDSSSDSEDAQRAVIWDAEKTSGFSRPALRHWIHLLFSSFLFIASVATRLFVTSRADLSCVERIEPWSMAIPLSATMNTLASAWAYAVIELTSSIDRPYDTFGRVRITTIQLG